MVKVIRILSKKLLVTAIVMAGAVTLMQINLALGVIIMMGYSSWMVINSSRQEMPLTKLTALLPGAMSVLCFLLLVALLGVRNPLMPIIGCGAGVIFGILMAKGHKVYTKNGVVYSQRTSLYILIWSCSILFTQGSTLLGLRDIVDFGLLLNGFSTSGMVVLSLYLFQCRSRGLSAIKAGVSSQLFVITFFLCSVIVPVQVSLAVSFNNNQSDLSGNVGRYIFSNELFNFLNTGGVTPEINEDKAGYHVSFEKNKKIINTRRTNNSPKYKTLKSKVKLKIDNGSYSPEKLKDYKRRTAIKNLKEAKRALCPFGIEFSRPSINGIKVNKCVERHPQGSFLSGTVDYINTTIVYGFTIDEWAFTVEVQDVEGNDEHRFGITKGKPEQYGNAIVSHVIDKFNTIEFGSFISGRDSGSNNNGSFYSGSNSGNSGYNNSFPEGISDEAAAATAAAAIIQILLGLGLSGANAVAQTTASAAMAAAQEAVQDVQSDSPSPSNNIMLSGAEAYDWLKDKKNGYVDEEGNPTDKYTKFQALLPSQQNPDLQGIAVYEDDDGNPIFLNEDGEPVEELTIIISAETTTEKAELEPEEQTEEVTVDFEVEEKKEEQEEIKEQEQQKTPTNHDESSEEESTNKEASDQKQQPEKQSPPAQPVDTKVDQQPEETAPLEFPNAWEDLENVMKDIIEEKTKEGYYVTNPNFVEKAWNGTLGGIINWLSGYKGGSCGDFASGAEWDEKTEGGIKWSEEKIKKLFGEGTLVTDITCERQNAWLGPWNHSATKVILPNGDRYVVDFWEGMQTQKPAVYKEDKWLSKWKDKLHDKSEVMEKLDHSGHVPGSPVSEFWDNVTDIEAVFYDEVEILRSKEERYLKNDMENWSQKYGEDYVKQKFINDADDKKLATSIVKSWEKNPW